MAVLARWVTRTVASGEESTVRLGARRGPLLPRLSLGVASLWFAVPKFIPRLSAALAVAGGLLHRTAGASGQLAAGASGHRAAGASGHRAAGAEGAEKSAASPPVSPAPVSPIAPPASSSPAPRTAVVREPHATDPRRGKLARAGLHAQRRRRWDINQPYERRKFHV